MALAFAKYQGTGNDFLVIEGQGERDWTALAPRLCDRHYGVGADGLLIVSTDPFKMLVVNADGSIPEMCGNGLRCVARYLHDRGKVGLGPFEVVTGAGVLRPEVLPDLQVTVDMGRPILERERIPMLGPAGGPVVEELVDDWLVTAVSMGNPHAVIFVRDVEGVPLASWGPGLETHPSFPAKTNVEFAQVLDRGRARMRVWERGAGPTLACGTGACATLVAGVLTGRMDRAGVIELPGGPLAIRWDDEDHVWLTGEARPVFTGEIALSACG
jgi:diaminopimelate epimerase